MCVIKSFGIEENEGKNFDKDKKNFLEGALEDRRWKGYCFGGINSVRDLGRITVTGVG
ncbi:hypothetical protein [Staphylococcus epidermidis]|uniref:hypothetical protein n=1 Tax=Staphylococcus epidermidis TaxID=1282 RepID=UPI00164326AB|nr:hypothetical protein [Staphylococcus epidermidis]